MKKQSKRDKKGRFAKGGKAGPGRPKGEPRDIICKDGKRRSVEALINDLLATYEKLGGDAFLKSWAVHSHRNLSKFIEILFKFAPHPLAPSQGPGSLRFDFGKTPINVISAVPRIKVDRIYTDERPDELGSKQGGAAMRKRIRELQDELKEKDEELRQLRELPVQDVEEIEHEPIRPGELPEHREPGIKEMTDDELDLEIARIQKEIENEDAKTKAL